MPIFDSSPIMKKFIQIVPNYPLTITFKEDYFTWPALMMKEKGYEPEILLVEKGKPSELIRGIKVRRFGNAFSLLLYAAGQDAFVHSHLRPYLASLLAALLPKKKAITPFTYELGSTPLIKSISLFLMKRFDLVIPISPYEEELYIKHGFQRKKVKFIPLAIDYHLFANARKDESIAKKFAIRKSSLTVITVANFRYFKRADIILRAFKKLKEQVKDAQLIIVGGDWLAKENKPTIAQMIKEMGIDGVLHLGYQPAETVCKILKFADVFVNSSSVESQCITAYEAAASALPLCLSDIPSFTYVFKENALFHKYDDPEALLANILRYHNDKTLAKKHSAMLKDLVKEWDHDVVKRKMWEAYKELL
jgi:glycosyltransferase involved in cell wall biosynthesis